MGGIPDGSVPTPARVWGAVPCFHAARAREISKMKAAIFRSPCRPGAQPLEVTDVAKPPLRPGHVLLRVLACGVCRTDLHIIDGELPMLRPVLIPGHQIVGEVREGADADLPVGSRVGVCWMGGVDGDCPLLPPWNGEPVRPPDLYRLYGGRRLRRIRPGPPGLRLSVAGRSGCRPCRSVVVRRDHRLPQPASRRSRTPRTGWSVRIRIFGQPGDCWSCNRGNARSTSRRGENRTASFAASLGATWVGTEHDRPPVELDRAITFAPSGDVVVSASREPAERRRGGHQRDPPRPDARLRLRQFCSGASGKSAASRI